MVGHSHFSTPPDKNQMISRLFISGSRKIQSHTGLTDNELVEARQRGKMEVKVAQMLKEMFSQTIFLLFLLCVCYGNHDADVYRQNNHLRQMFIGHTQLKASYVITNVIE